MEDTAGRTERELVKQVTYDTLVNIINPIKEYHA
jgi:hypothetical protein